VPAYTTFRCRVGGTGLKMFAVRGYPINSGMKDEPGAPHAECGIRAAAREAGWSGLRSGFCGHRSARPQPRPHGQRRGNATRSSSGQGNVCPITDTESVPRGRSRKRHSHREELDHDQGSGQSCLPTPNLTVTWPESPTP
jgi:hypothetical protein